MKYAAIHNGKHMRPMHAILTRYGIGKTNPYTGAIIISEADLPAIRAAMLSDKTCIIGDAQGTPLVDGSNSHNSVWYTDFESLFM